MVLAASTPVIVGFGILYVILMLTLGITAIRKGHWVMFIVGLIVPVFWVIGALMPPRRPA